MNNSIKIAQCLALALGTVATQAGGLLYVTDGDPWGSTAVQNDLGSLGISYTQTTFGSANWSGLGSYRAILLQGADGQSDNYLAGYAAHQTDIDNYVANGGLLLVHFAGWSGSQSLLAPGGVTYTADLTEDLVPAAGHAADPLLAGGVNLNGWNYSAHGFLGNLPAGTESVVDYTNGDGPAYVRYAYGTGSVWLTGMTMEWGGADPGVLRNELSLAVPEPGQYATIAGLGLVGLGVLRRGTRRS